jgi:PAS domain S-box-containing protein
MTQQKSSLRLTFFSAYLIGALVLLVTGWLAYQSLHLLIEKNRWVDHTSQVILTSERTLSLLKDAETGQRGYALSRDSTYLEPYFHSIDSVAPLVSALASLTRDNPRQQARIPTIKEAIDQKLRVMEQGIELTNTHPERLLAFYASRQGKQRMDQVRELLLAFEQEEKRLLAQRTQELDESILKAQYTVYWIVISYVLVVLVMFTVVKYFLRKQEEDERQLQRLYGQLELTNQELASVNEELSATNEELHATNEELQTTNEELSATNEALHASQKQLEQVQCELEHLVQERTLSLEQSQKRFRLLVETLPQMAFMATAQGEITFFNLRWYEYTGLAQQADVNESWKEVIHPHDLALTLTQWEHALQTGESFEIKNRFRRASDGQYRWHLSQALPLRDEHGQIVHWVGSNTDIHKEIEREEALIASNQRLEALNLLGQTISSHLELTGLVQAVTDVTTQVSRAEFGAFFYNTLNEQGEHMTLYALSGADRQAFAHFPLPRHTAIFGPTFRGEGILRVDDITQHEHFGKNLPYQGLPKGHLPVKSYLALPVVSRSGQVLGGLFFGHSQVGVFSKDVEELLSELMPQVAIAIDHAFLFEASQSDRQKLAQANEQLQRSNQELKLTNQELDSFIYTASHELKSPIVNIEGLLKVLEKQGSKPQPNLEQVKDVYRMLYDSVNRFKATVQDLTQISYLTKENAREVVSVYLQEIFQEVQKDLFLPIQEAGVQWEIDLACDPIRFSGKNLKIILYNLLSNALKYRSRDRQLTLRVSCQLEGEYQVLSIQDNGLGIDQPHQGRIFGLFKRMHTHVEGTGIGLYIVKKMVEDAQGKIEVESQVGKGSIFRVYFQK